MMRLMKKYRSFILRMAGFVVFLSLLIFVGGTIITGKFWLPDLYENFVFVACCTFCCSVILHGLYERIYRLPRFLFFSTFMLLSTLGVGIGLMISVLILEGKFFLHINFLLFSKNLFNAETKKYNIKTTIYSSYDKGFDYVACT